MYKYFLKKITCFYFASKTVKGYLKLVLTNRVQS